MAVFVHASSFRSSRRERVSSRQVARRHRQSTCQLAPIGRISTGTLGFCTLERVVAGLSLTVPCASSFRYRLVYYGWPWGDRQADCTSDCIKTSPKLIEHVFVPA